MVFISKLKLRNFKSFKDAFLTFPKTYIAIAGPNGSGKSNILDSIRFVLGETSLKSLRAKKIKELIHSDAKSAEVTITFEDAEGKSHEIKRAIREDGKILYKINGEKATRSSVLETLKRYNLDDSGRNTVAQGEVQRIIGMGGKERRLIIDSVAGIADFEEKKKEAMRELEVVDTRIKDSNLVLGERKAFVDELEREKETALKYIETKKTLTNAKGTILKTEIDKTENELKHAIEAEEKITVQQKAIEDEIAEIEVKVKAVEDERYKTSKELQSKQDTQIMIRRIEELRAGTTSKDQGILEKRQVIVKSSEEADVLKKEIEKSENEIKELKKEVEELRANHSKSKEELEKQGILIEEDTVREAREYAERIEKEVFGLREKIVAIKTEIKAKKELLDAKKQEMNSLPQSVTGEAGNEQGEESGASLAATAQRLGKEIEDMFKRTKEINAKIVEIDREMLEMKEKAAIHKVRNTPHMANPALGLIKELKNKGEQGIYGIVADLISSEAKFSGAVEAAAGGRLMYVVVDRVDTATRVIEKLKAARAGRATFIPLDTVRSAPATKVKGFPSVIDVVEFSEQVRPAMEYIFAETILINSTDDAKKVGIGTARMVTIEGEIFERSGIVSGGRAESGMLSANAYRKIEEEISNLKSSKDSFLSELYSIREEESKIRAEKAQAEIKLKTMQMQTKMNEDKRKEMGSMIKRKDELVGQIQDLDHEIAKMAKEEKDQTLKNLEKEGELAGAKENLLKIEEEARSKTRASSDTKANLSAKVSSIKATAEGKEKEAAIRENELSEKQGRLKNIEKTEMQARKSIDELEKVLIVERKELREIEHKLSSTSKEIEGLFGKMKECEAEFARLGKEIGQRRIALDKINKEITQLSIKKATANTHLSDIRAEFVNYSEFEELKLDRDELRKMVSENEKIISSMTNVNMTAIEMFDKKKAEIEEVGQRIETLNKEREAIISMISEIEERKRDAFFETYKAVNEHFVRMFKYGDIGEGHLFLDNPQSPFESGLFIKVRRNNKEYSLDAFSGGEKTLVAMMFIFALQFFKPSPFYILDEVDAALDKQNSRRLAELLGRMATDSQFIVVTHNDTVMSLSETVIGVSKMGGVSKVVGVKLTQKVAST
ncbi:chromosome segregation protein SMC [Candidatus Micrarchaeota archaeon]|nr:chromosome segregation protein SMC [Candidatus Micrarchaeota archaeon]